ncbi:MAG TPA: TIGR03067 domain-containing protein [Gemmataceae bacterium]|nr:TIGR03067 domain-containing protein [Gemmataceae bacterium]
MKRRTGAIIFVVLLLGADTQKDDAVKTETNKLQGTWRVVEAERDGVKAPGDETKKITLVIKGDKLTAKRTENAGKPEEKNYEMSFTLDPTKNPKWIDVTYTDGERKGESSLGIYELKDDSLKICMSRGTTRPMEFETKMESQRHMMVLKREK